MNVKTEVLNILSQALEENKTTNKNELQLHMKLDRKMYAEVNKVLELAGGKWNRKTKSHVFNTDVESILEEILLTGQIESLKKDFDYFPTPDNIVNLMINNLVLSDAESPLQFLEPSAGQGAIADKLAKLGKVTCVELNHNNAEILRKKNYLVVEDDFLLCIPEARFDFIVMNPPFAKQQDIHHVNHAFKFLKEGGVLTSVMSAGVTFRENKLTKEFRDFVYNQGGEILNLPQDSFKSSGTSVNTCLVVIPK